MKLKFKPAKATTPQRLKQRLRSLQVFRGSAALLTVCIAVGSALGIASGLVASPAFAQPPPPKVLTLPYTDAQYARTARSICRRIDLYKRNSEAHKLRRPKMCSAVPAYCADESRTYLDMKGFIRTTVGSLLKIETPEVLEAQLPTILSKLMTYPCSTTSSFALEEVPFHNMKRNIAKRAIFTGQTDSFFSDFVLEEFSATYRNGGDWRTAIRIDINAVERVEGEPETLLDYLDKVLAWPDELYLGGETRTNIISLRNSLLRRGAVNASDLNCTEPHQIYCPVSAKGKQRLRERRAFSACDDACRNNQQAIGEPIKRCGMISGNHYSEPDRKQCHMYQPTDYAQCLVQCPTFDARDLIPKMSSGKDPDRAMRRWLEQRLED